MIWTYGNYKRKNTVKKVPMYDGNAKGDATRVLSIDWRITTWVLP